MDLGQVLQAAGLNRNSYNTMVRRAGLDFMRFAYSGPAAARYEPWHAVCLASVLELQDGGLALEHASRAITGCQNGVRTVAERATAEAVDPAWLSVEFPERMESYADMRVTLGMAAVTPDAETTRYLLAVNLAPRIRSTLRRIALAANPPAAAVAV